MSEKLKVHLALLAVTLFYGGNYVVAKIAMGEHLAPLGLIFIRVACSLPFFFIVHRALIGERVQRRDLPLFAACGLFGVAINQIFFLKGLDLTTEINASLIMITTPIVVVIFSRLLLKNPITPRKMIGILLGCVGAGLIISNGRSLQVDSGTFWGDLFIFLNAASYALYLVLVKPLTNRYHPLTIVKWVFLFGSLLALPIGWSDFASTQWSEFTGLIWMSVAYVVLFATFCTYLLNAIAIKGANPSLVSAYIYGQPLVATTLATLLGTDSLTSVKLLAAGLIFSGVYLVSSSSKTVNAG